MQHRNFLDMVIVLYPSCGLMPHGFTVSSCPAFQLFEVFPTIHRVGGRILVPTALTRPFDVLDVITLAARLDCRSGVRNVSDAPVYAAAPDSRRDPDPGCGVEAVAWPASEAAWRRAFWKTGSCLAGGSVRNECAGETRAFRSQGWES